MCASGMEGRVEWSNSEGGGVNRKASGCGVEIKGKDRLFDTIGSRGVHPPDAVREITVLAHERHQITTQDSP